MPPSTKRTNNDRNSYFLEEKNDKKDLKRSSTEGSISGEDEEEVAWLDLSTIGNIFDHEGSSLFLRFGTLSEHIVMTIRFIYDTRSQCLQLVT